MCGIFVTIGACRHRARVDARPRRAMRANASPRDARRAMPPRGGARATTRRATRATTRRCEGTHRAMTSRVARARVVARASDAREGSLLDAMDDACPVPRDQRPRAQYEELRDGVVQSWPTRGAAGYAARVTGLFGFFYGVVAYPIACESYDPTSQFTETCVSALVGASGATAATTGRGIRTRYQGDWLDVGGKDGTCAVEECVERWRAAPFEPYAGRGKDCAYAVCAGETTSERARRGAATVMREISREYAALGLGTHASMVEGDDAGLFDGAEDGASASTLSALERYSRTLSSAAQRAAELGALGPRMCVIYVVIPDEVEDIDALTVIALASHVMSAATASVARRFLSVSVQAIPASWCEDAYSWSSTSVRAMAFNVFTKLTRPTVTRGLSLPNDHLNDAPRSFRTSETTDGREGVSGAAVVGRRTPHPLFRIPETSSERNLPPFPAYEPLYTLTPEIDDDDSRVRGLHCAYVVAASRWIVASWSDSHGEFLTLEAEPFADEADCLATGLRWLIDRTSALAEQLAFAYGAKANERLKFQRAAICRLGAPSSAERAALETACKAAPAPLDRDFLTRLEMTCFEPDSVPARIAALVPTTARDVSFVAESVEETKTVKTYAAPPCAQKSFRVAFNTNVSSARVRALDATTDMNTLKHLAALYATRLSQLGMMCLSENIADEFGSIRAPLPLHAEVCVRFASTLQTLEANGEQ